MLRTFRWSLAVCCLAGGYLDLFCTDAISDPKRDPDAAQIPTLTEKANGIIKQIQEVSEQFNLRYIGPKQLTSKGLDVSQHWKSPVVDRFFTGPQTALRWKEVGFSFCDSDSGLTNYDNNAIYDLPGTWAFYDKQPKPNWSVDHVKDIAEAFKKIFFTSKNVFIGLPHVSYEPNYEVSGEKLKYHTGQWDVTWWRTDSQGHEFIGGDHISMILKEGLSPLMVTILVKTPFEEVRAEPIAKQKAIEVALSDVNSRREKWKPTPDASDYPEFKASGYRFRTASLQIALPYDPSVSPKATQERMPARLIWAVYFDLVYPPGTQPARDDSNGATSQVDAFTGKTLTYDSP